MKIKTWQYIVVPLAVAAFAFAGIVASKLLERRSTKTEVYEAPKGKKVTVTVEGPAGEPIHIEMDAKR